MQSAKRRNIGIAIFIAVGVIALIVGLTLNANRELITKLMLPACPSDLIGIEQECWGEWKSPKESARFEGATYEGIIGPNQASLKPKRASVFDSRKSFSYEGGFSNGQPNGKGVLRDGDTTLTVTFKNAIAEGPGEFEELGDAKFAGTYRNDLRNGPGKLTQYSDTYDGTWEDGYLRMTMVDLAADLSILQGQYVKLDCFMSSFKGDGDAICGANSLSVDLTVSKRDFTSEENYKTAISLCSGMLRGCPVTIRGTVSRPDKEYLFVADIYVDKVEFR